LELSFAPQGLRVEEILQIPGQRGLQVGCVITAVDGVPLDAQACGGEEGQEQRFSELLHHGARLACFDEEVGRGTTTKFRVGGPRCTGSFQGIK